MKLLSTFTFESNALFVKAILNDSAITSEIKVSQGTIVPSFDLMVNDKDLSAAQGIISSLDLDEDQLDVDSEGYWDGHHEWSQKMYDPGHYTGGKIPHFYLNKKAWKYIAPAILVAVIASGIFMYTSESYLSLEMMFWMSIYLFLGISMLWQLRKKN